MGGTGQRDGRTEWGVDRLAQLPWSCTCYLGETAGEAAASPGARHEHVELEFGVGPPAPVQHRIRLLETRRDQKVLLPITQSNVTKSLPPNLVMTAGFGGLKRDLGNFLENKPLSGCRLRWLNRTSSGILPVNISCWEACSLHRRGGE